MVEEKNEKDLFLQKKWNKNKFATNAGIFGVILAFIIFITGKPYLKDYLPNDGSKDLVDNQKPDSLHLQPILPPPQPDSLENKTAVRNQRIQDSIRNREVIDSIKAETDSIKPASAHQL